LIFLYLFQCVQISFFFSLFLYNPRTSSIRHFSGPTPARDVFGTSSPSIPLRSAPPRLVWRKRRSRRRRAAATWRRTTCSVDWPCRWGAEAVGADGGSGVWGAEGVHLECVWVGCACAKGKGFRRMSWVGGGRAIYGCYWRDSWGKEEWAEQRHEEEGGVRKRFYTMEKCVKESRRDEFLSCRSFFSVISRFFCFY
jgi:hypothetical protein